MKNQILLIFLCLSGISFGQNTDSITCIEEFGKYQFYQGGGRLSMSKLITAMKPNEKAYKEMKEAQSTYIISHIIGFAGGFMIGWPIGIAMHGGDPNWTLAGVGAGLIVVQIAINQQYSKQAKSAVDTFNGGLKTSSFWYKTELRFVMRGNGLGLKLLF